MLSSFLIHNGSVVFSRFLLAKNNSNLISDLQYKKVAFFKKKRNKMVTEEMIYFIHKIFFMFSESINCNKR